MLLDLEDDDAVVYKLGRAAGAGTREVLQGDLGGDRAEQQQPRTVMKTRTDADGAATIRAAGSTIRRHGVEETEFRWRAAGESKCRCTRAPSASYYILQSSKEGWIRSHRSRYTEQWRLLYTLTSSFGGLLDPHLFFFF
jgi:hypothetical protein